ncbi:hypothetical protein GGQ22_15615 [Nocardioides sp. zg-579]|uniref:PASTA domain-containing protein n=1 Tax=Nocardioides marmotae TaxID=2663857 RepID=A0A6I3JEF7_9ACTN|nr:PASTA domain-containing protein [Nocardioides marmotae]MCR6032852.1 hypothetical protein [Gordonia jinghuaiqii]MTB96502.1 hypothetical protein [Nocardioides marmotae]QKE01976.1 hypothetical protein HPC71_13515 [Nocardioides marmotae]
MKLRVLSALVVAAGMLTACGEDEPAVMPEVVSMRLDVALSDIERAGFEDEVEVIGGGMFGVVDESNWIVCGQEPATSEEISGAPRLTVDRSCDDEDSAAGQDEADAASESPQPARTPTKKPQPTKKPAANTGGGKNASADTFVMPSTVGMVLQDAQDLLQSLGSYILTQTDATGAERFQVLDSGWKVCWQDPAPGTVTPLSTMVDLGAVKLHEACP